jgi:RHS repeat-associated protein
MTAVIKPQVFNPEGGTNANPRYEYDHDSYGNILSIRDPKGHQTKFTYDALGEPISRTLPLLQTNRQSYNALGQLDTSVDFKGQSNRFVYDSFGRVATNLFYAAGSSIPSQTNIFIYDANGRLYQTIRPEGISTFQYNIDGAVTNILSPEGRISYEYDPAMGWLTRAYTINSDVRYGYDELSRLKTVSVVKRDGTTLSPWEVTTNTYTKLGSLQNVFFPNGTWTVYQYDVMNRLTNLTHQAGATNLAIYSYELNTTGQRTNAVEILRQENGTYLTNTLSWQYDGLNRLTNEVLICSTSSASYTNSYAYDLAGNRLKKVHTGGTSETVTYAYDSNDELTGETNGAAITTYLYDANGSLTNKTVGTTVNSYTYNLENKLAAVAVNGTTNATYQYNDQGIRVSKTTGGNTTHYLIDANNHTGYPQILEELLTVGGTPTMTYTIGNQVVAQETNGIVSYLMSDGHSNTRQLTTANGAVSSHYNYDAYGVVQTGISSTTAEAAPTSLLFCGEQYDSVLQMYNLRARYYDISNGRFNQQDAVDGTPDDPLNLHKYAYCQNNPVNMHDPSGNQGDIGSMMCAMSIGASLDAMYNGAVLVGGYIAGAKVTELGASRESLLETAARDPSPGVDTATIIIPGVSGHPYGWAQGFQGSLGLNHDFYEFDWGGFSIGNIPGTLIPIKSVHEMALVHLKMMEMLVSMNGYANIDIISHSWGTCLSYDLMNNSSVEVKDWVTMGSPLKQTTRKPIENTGKWINCYDLNDPIVHLEIFPPFPNLPLYASWHSFDLYQGIPSFGPGLTGDPNNVTQGYNREFDFHAETGHWWVHSDYWISQKLQTHLRNDLQ